MVRIDFQPSAGDFTLRITVTDKMTKKKVAFEAPLKVTAP